MNKISALFIVVSVVGCGPTAGMTTSGSGGSGGEGGADAGPHVGSCMTDVDCESRCAKGHCVLSGPTLTGQCTYDSVQPAGSVCIQANTNQDVGACSGIECNPISCTNDAACSGKDRGFCRPGTCGSKGVCVNNPRCAATDTCDPDNGVMMCFPGKCGIGATPCGGIMDPSCCPGTMCANGSCRTSNGDCTAASGDACDPTATAGDTCCGTGLTCDSANQCS